MKVSSMKAWSVLVALVLFLSSSCNEDEVIPKRSDEELIALTLEKLASNESVLDDVFLETSETVTRTAIQNTLKASSTKAAFIANMNGLVEEIFENNVKSNSEQLASDMFLKLEGIRGESIRTTVSEFVLDQAYEDPLVSYSNKVKTLLDASNASGRSSVALIAKVVDEETSQSAPVEQVSLNFEKIRFMYELQDRIVHSGSNGISAETDNEMESILAQNGIPPVAIGLLLPAVQKIRESAATESAGLPYWDWLTEVVNPEINGGLNRDIIRRYNAAGFMGALQFLLSNEYKNDNQDLASMLLFRARYQASLMFLWSDIWEKSKLAATMKTRVKSNEAILDSAFAETAKVITRKTILDARAASADKAAFVSKMNQLVEDIFDREVLERSQVFGSGVVVATGDLTGDGLSSKLEGFVIKQGVADPLEAYLGEIQILIANRAKIMGNTPGDLDPSFTIVNRVTESGVEKQSYMSVTTESISKASEIKNAVLNGRKNGADPNKAVEDLAVLYKMPSPLMALLLPAIQRVRNYNGTMETADTRYLQWVESLDPMLIGGAGHDAVSKYDAAGFLGALNLFVSDKYRGDNQDYASLLLLKARYQASLAVIFGDLWDK